MLRLLGRRPHDPVQLARAPQLAARLVPQRAPAQIDRSTVKFAPGLFDNDKIGDCTAVALANCALAAAALRGETDLHITTADVVCFYEESTGYVWNDPQTDKGAVIADILAYQSQHGFPVENGDLKGAWGTFDPADRNLMGVALDVVGAINLGVDLSVSDQTTDIWDTEAPAGAGDPTPGSWGGHSLVLWSYDGLDDTNLVRLATWGEFKLATWRWVRERAAEAHAIAWRRFGAMLPGLDYEALVADGALFNG